MTLICGVCGREVETLPALFDGVAMAYDEGRIHTGDVKFPACERCFDGILANIRKINADMQAELESGIP